MLNTLVLEITWIVVEGRREKLEDILSKAITKRSIFVSSFTWISLIIITLEN